MKSGRLPGGLTLPLVIEPTTARERRLPDLLGWLDGGGALRAPLLEHGAVLLRGFDVDGPEDFQQLVQALAHGPSDYTRGISPRSRVLDGVYTSTELPPYFPIPQHNEMSYTSRWPRQVLFYCDTAPSDRGETPLADMRRVHADIDPAVRDRFERLGVRIIQNVPRRPRLFEPKGWPEMFGTEATDDVLDVCRSEGIEASFLADGTLRLLERTPGAIRHPVTGEACWFNSATTFHDSFSRELWREGLWALGTAVATLEQWRRWRVADHACARHCTFGDGSPISVEVMEHVRAVHRRHMVAFSWARGDVLVVDNVLASHGRRPFRGPRRILAALVPRGPEDAPQETVGPALA